MLSTKYYTDGEIPTMTDKVADDSRKNHAHFSEKSAAVVFEN
jgi:hypothetical protein